MFSPLKYLLTVAFVILSRGGYAEIQGTDDFRVNVKSGVEDTRFQSESMDLAQRKEGPQAARSPAMLLNPKGPEGYKLLSTEQSENTLPEPVTTRRPALENHAMLDDAVVDQLAFPSAVESLEGSAARGGLFWAIILGVGLLFIVLFLLLKGGDGGNDEAKKKRRVEIR